MSRNSVTYHIPQSVVGHAICVTSKLVSLEKKKTIDSSDSLS